MWSGRPRPLPLLLVLSLKLFQTLAPTPAARPHGEGYDFQSWGTQPKGPELAAGAR
jgi:hypothetical protein